MFFKARPGCASSLLSFAVFLMITIMDFKHLYNMVKQTNKLVFCFCEIWGRFGGGFGEVWRVMLVDWMMFDMFLE